MTPAFLLARGNLPMVEENTRVLWACTGCLACRENCDHRNPVASTLLAARAEARTAGAVPEVVRHALASAVDTRTLFTQKLRKAAGSYADPSARWSLLVGCDQTEEDAVATVRLAALLLGEPVRLPISCCGNLFLRAGDHQGFLREAQGLLEELGPTQLLVADPGCLSVLRETLETLGVGRISCELLLERAFSSFGRFERVHTEHPVRYHDSCTLGRGLGVYDPPRALLSRILDGRPAEFTYHHAQSRCAGGGALAELVWPDIANRMTDARIAEHTSLGGGTIVAASTTSVARFRARGANAYNLYTLLSSALPER